MKKLVLICMFSLLSTTIAFAGFKSKMRSALDKAEEFIENNFSSEKIEASLEKTNAAIENALDKIEEFIECNLNPEKIGTLWNKANKAVLDTFSKAKKNSHELKESTMDAIVEVEKLADSVDHKKVESALKKGKELVLTAYDNAKHYVANLNTEEAEVSFEKAKENIENFKEKYSEPSFKEKLDLMTDAEYVDMCNEYSKFVTSCMYLNVLEDIATPDNNESNAKAADSSLTERMEKMQAMLDQLSELIKLQSSAFSGETKIR